MITKTGLHAIRALVNLAKLPAGTFAGAAHVARDIDAPENYLAKLLQALVPEGLVVSRKGLGGGFRLARDSRKITLLDVVEPIEHLSRKTGCFLGWRECSDKEPCALHNQWKVVRSAYLQMLARTTLADLVQGGEPKALGG
jgi:Rrf2 family transcriptional regulator, iron-sulfur cluster assembly transcription factor